MLNEGKNKNNTPSSKKMTKNYSIEFFRFFFMMMICFHHHNQTVLNASYIGVEFYFVLSGYFLYRSLNKVHSLSTIDFTINKIKRFLPKILLVMPIALYAKWERDSLDTFYHNLSGYLSDCFCFGGMFGLDYPNANEPIWYISVLIWAGSLLYGLIKYNKKLAINVILPLISVLGGTNIVSRNFNLFDIEYCFPAPFVRGLTEMSMGILLAYFMKVKNDYLASKKRIISIASFIGMLGFIGFALVLPLNPAFVFFCLLLFLLGLINTGTFLQRAFNHKCWEFCGSLSLDMLIVHMPIINIFHFHSAEWTMSPILKTVILFVIILISSVILHFGYQILNKKHN